jgi:hypothetical protein
MVLAEGCCVGGDGGEGGDAGGVAGDGEGDGVGEDGGDGVTNRGGVAGKVGGAGVTDVGVTDVGDTGSRFSLAGNSSGGERTSDDAVVGVSRLEGEGGENEGGVAAPAGGETRKSPSSSSPRSSSNSLRLLLVLFAGGEMISGDGGGETGRCGLRGFDSTASGVGVHGLSPAAVAAAGAVVALGGVCAWLAPGVGTALPRRRRRRRRRRRLGCTAVAALKLEVDVLHKGNLQETVAVWNPATWLKITRAL